VRRRRQGHASGLRDGVLTIREQAARELLEKFASELRRRRVGKATCPP
jgi:hypothetical protein